MSSWRSLLLRIGDNCPDYGTSSDFKEHIVSTKTLILIFRFIEKTLGFQDLFLKPFFLFMIF
jgi:hypothetical protein